MDEHQSQIEVDEYGEPINSYHVLTRLPMRLTNPQCQARYVPGAAKKYCAYLEKCLDDGGAWEGLAYLYSRMVDPSTYAPGIEASDLDDPLETDYSLLSYQAELRALTLRPTSMGLRRSVMITLGNAISRSGYDSPTVDAAIVELYGGVDGARLEQLHLVDATLDLIIRFPERWPDEAREWQVRRAELLSDLKEWQAAQDAWTEVLTVSSGWAPETKDNYPILGKPSYAHLMLFECAMHFGEYNKARQHLDAAKKFDKKAKLNIQRFELLQATSPLEARKYARQQAENALRDYAKDPDDAYLHQAADWFLRGGDVVKAREHWQKLAENRGSRLQQRAQQELAKLDEY